MASQGTKRKRDHGSSDSPTEASLTTGGGSGGEPGARGTSKPGRATRRWRTGEWRKPETGGRGTGEPETGEQEHWRLETGNRRSDMDIRKQAKQIIKEVNVKINAITTRGNTRNALTHIVDTISKMDMMDEFRWKATIGIFGRTGEGKSKLLNAILGEKSCNWSELVKIPNCHELLEHLVFVELPGTGDDSRIEDELWRCNLRKCSSLWIVSDIKRAITDKDPWKILDHCIQDLGPGGECKSINFICTKTDDIKPEEEYLRSAQLTKKHILGDDGHLKTQCILNRNNRAKKAVETKFNKDARKKSNKRFITDVFTVSAMAYLDQNSHLNPLETEIPQLWNVLESLNKSINHKLTRDYISEAKGVLSLIQSVHLDTYENMTKPRVLKDLEEKLQEELKKLDCQFDSFFEILEQCLSKGVKKSVKSCVKTIGKKIFIRPKTKKGFHRIYRAMCERGGCYWPRYWKKPIDINKYLTKHMYANINKEFELMFPVDDKDKTKKSVQDHLDKFTIIHCDSPRSSWQQHIENFIKTQETKLKASLSRDIVEEKKKIYLSIQRTIQKKMTPGYKKAGKVTGEGSIKKMEDIITETIEKLKPQMFNKAKEEALKMFRFLKVHIMKTLETQLKTSVERSLSQIKIPLLDVSREIQELERLSEQLSA